MGNFEKLSVLVIVVIIVMILVVALYTWTDKPKDTQEELASGSPNLQVVPPDRGADAQPPAPDETWPPDDEFFNRDDEEEGVETPASDTPESSVVPELPPVTPEPPVTPDPAPEVAADDGIWEYTIQAGDTISQICERELGSWRRQKEVMKLNPDLDPLRIRPGQVLKMPPRTMAAKAPQSSSIVEIPAKGPKGTIPSGDWYVVRSGDRLSTIAKRAYGSIDRWPELWARNLSVVKDPDALTAGQRIYVPK